MVANRMQVIFLAVLVLQSVIKADLIFNLEWLPVEGPSHESVTGWIDIDAASFSNPGSNDPLVLGPGGFSLDVIADDGRDAGYYDYTQYAWIELNSTDRLDLAKDLIGQPQPTAGGVWGESIAGLDFTFFSYAPPPAPPVSPFGETGFRIILPNTGAIWVLSSFEPDPRNPTYKTPVPGAFVLTLMGIGSLASACRRRRKN